LYDSYLQLLVEKYKNNGTLGNKMIFLFDKMLYVLSLDLKRMKNISILI